MKQLLEGTALNKEQSTLRFSRDNVDVDTNLSKEEEPTTDADIDQVDMCKVVVTSQTPVNALEADTNITKEEKRKEDAAAIANWVDTGMSETMTASAAPVDKTLEDLKAKDIALKPPSTKDLLASWVDTGMTSEATTPTTPLKKARTI